MSERAVRLPNFIIIGAAKSGTSAMFNYLRKHPDVFMSPVKETNYFALAGAASRYRGPDGIPGVHEGSVYERAQYDALFAGANRHKAVGEASPLYLYDPAAPPNIHQTLPNAQLIAVLRNPVDRAYSSYLHLKRSGMEPASSFEEALELEAERIRDNWGLLWRYRDLGQYAVQLKRYFELFGRDQVHVFLYDDFDRDPAAIMTRIYEIIGADPTVKVDYAVRYNASGIPIYPTLNRFLNRPNAAKRFLKRLMPVATAKRMKARLNVRNLKRSQMLPETRRRLTREFEAGTRELGSLIDRDLDAWLREAK